MALLAEEIVEEWLNRRGCFTIRGIRLGVHEIDLLAVKHLSDGRVERRHVEVQASMRPMSYISRVPKELQRQGRAANSAARSEAELIQGVAEWVEKKFHSQKKKQLMESLWRGPWSSELVINEVKSEAEVELIANHGITVHRLRDVVNELREPEGFVVKSAASADFIDLLQMGADAQQGAGADAEKPRGSA